MRQAERRRTIRKRVVTIVGVTAGVVGVATAVYLSPVFTIDTVEVRGTEVLAADEVATRIDIPAGATLLRFPRSHITSELAGDPWIADVRLGADLPSTLVVTVRERVPLALVDTSTEFWFMDADGRMLGISTLETTDSPLPVIRDVPALAPMAGEVCDDVTLANARAVLLGVSDDLRQMVRAVSAASAGETTLVTETGVEIMVGEAVQLREKSSLALDIMTEQGAKVVFIDVRSVDRPISRGL